MSRRGIVGLSATALASAALLLVLFLRLMSAGSAVSATSISPIVGHPAPNFAITTWNGTVGQQIHLADLKGKPVVINFWASWCDSCQEEQQLLESRWQQYQSKGVMFIGIAYQDKQDPGMAYLKQYGVTYPAGPSTSDLVPVNYAVTGVPETVFVNSKGIVMSKSIGLLDDGSLDRSLQSLLKS